MEAKTKNKRYLFVLIGALLLLGGAVWLNIRANADAEANAAEQGDAETEDSRETIANVFDDYFTSFRTQRSALRAQEIDYLRSIIDSESSDADTLADAQNRLLELVGNMEKEFTVESLIRSKGFLDAAATIGGGAASVVINGEQLTDEEVARILDIVISETGLSASNIKVSLSAGG